MAFDRFFFSLLSNPPRTNCPNIWTYVTDVDNAAAVRASGYFNPEGGIEGRLAVNDIIYAVSTDGKEWLSVTAVSPNVTTEVATNTIGDGAVTTAKLDDEAVTEDKLADDAVSTDKMVDGAVTLGKLDDGIAPSHIVKFADQHTTVGSAAAEPITVAGALATDLAFVQMVDNGTNNVTIVDAVVTAGTLTVTFSGDPGNDCVINYQLLRAAA